jgi:hypothetical protein
MWVILSRLGPSCLGLWVQATQARRRMVPNHNAISHRNRAEQVGENLAAPAAASWGRPGFQAGPPLPDRKGLLAHH